MHVHWVVYLGIPMVSLWVCLWFANGLWNLWMVCLEILVQKAGSEDFGFKRVVSRPLISVGCTLKKNMIAQWCSSPIALWILGSHYKLFLLQSEQGKVRTINEHIGWWFLVCKGSGHWEAAKEVVLREGQRILRGPVFQGRTPKGTNIQWEELKNIENLLHTTYMHRYYVITFQIWSDLPQPCHVQTSKGLQGPFPAPVLVGKSTQWSLEPVQKRTSG